MPPVDMTNIASCTCGAAAYKNSAGGGTTPLRFALCSLRPTLMTPPVYQDSAKGAPHAASVHPRCRTYIPQKKPCAVQSF